MYVPVNRKDVRPNPVNLNVAKVFQTLQRTAFFIKSNSIIVINKI